MIQTLEISKSFGTVRAVDGVSLTLESGVTGLVGINGAGKSTLLRLLAGIYTPEGGEIYVDGHNPRELEARKSLFLLPDDPFAPKGANITGVYRFYDSLFDLDKDNYFRLIDKFGLPTNRSVNSFSKGMRRQVFIAISLSMKAKHLLLDEAFDGLDPLVVEAIKNEVADAKRKGKIILISSHNIFALQDLVDHFIVLAQGKIAKDEEKEEMARQYIKFQAAFKEKVEGKDLEKIGLRLISFRNIGSVSHFVIEGNEEDKKRIEDHFPSFFIEVVPLDAQEVVSLEMAAAKQGKGE